MQHNIGLIGTLILLIGIIFLIGFILFKILYVPNKVKYEPTKEDSDKYLYEGYMKRIDNGEGSKFDPGDWIWIKEYEYKHEIKR